MTAVGFAVSQALVEYWKKVYVGPENALKHGMFMLAFAAMLQLGIVLAIFVFNGAAKWRILAASLMLPTFIFYLGYLIFWHITKFSYLIETSPIPAAVWITQLVIMPLTMLGYAIVLVQLRRQRIP
jgi:hypothetical protein